MNRLRKPGASDAHKGNPQGFPYHFVPPNLPGAARNGTQTEDSSRANTAQRVKECKAEI